MSKRKKRSVKRSVKRSLKKSTRRPTRRHIKKSNSRINIGKLDRVIRFLIAIIALPLGYYYSNWWYLLTIAGLYTAVVGRCEPYSWLGISTNK